MTSKLTLPPDEDVTKLTLTAIREAAKLVAGSVDDRAPLLRGRCVEVALTVRAVLGGDILGQVVPCDCEPGCEGTYHYWNLLPGGDVYDLTSDQFGGDGMSPKFSRGEVQQVPLARTFEVMGFMSKILDAMQFRVELVPL